jgi:hypothetical protein
MCVSYLVFYVPSRTDVDHSREIATEGASQRGFLTCMQTITQGKLYTSRKIQAKNI